MKTLVVLFLVVVIFSASLKAAEAKRFRLDDQILVDHELIRKRYSNVFGRKVLSSENGKEEKKSVVDTKTDETSQSHHLIIIPKNENEPTSKPP